MTKRELKLKLVKFHKQLCKELGIKPVPIYFIEDLEPGDSAASYRWDKYIKIKLNYCIEEGCNPFSYIAHETRHHYQRTMGWIGWTDKKSKGRRWKSKACTLRYYRWCNTLIVEGELKAYRHLPWEMDANRYMNFINDREGFDTYDV